MMKSLPAAAGRATLAGDVAEIPVHGPGNDPLPSGWRGPRRRRRGRPWAIVQGLKSRGHAARGGGLLDFLAAPDAAQDCRLPAGRSRHVDQRPESRRPPPRARVLRDDFKPWTSPRPYRRRRLGPLILTEEDHFQGHDRYLRDIARSVALPALRRISSSIPIRSSRPRCWRERLPAHRSLASSPSS